MLIILLKYNLFTRLIIIIGLNLKATEELRGRLGNLRSMYGTDIRALDDIAGELDGNSQSTFLNLNSEISKHFSSVEDVSISSPSPLQSISTLVNFIYLFQFFKIIASEADALFDDIQSNLHMQEEKLFAYAQQQREVCNWL